MKKVLLMLCLCFSTLCYSQNSGYEKSIELNGGAGLDKFTKYSMGISMINGYRFNDYFFMGIGLGFRYTEALYYSSYNHGDAYKSFDGKYLIPIYIRLKANLTDTKTSPFFSLDGGYTIDVGQNENKNTEGFMIEPAFGMDFKLNEGKLGLYCMIGCNLQKSKYNYYSITSKDVSIEEEKGMAGTLTFKFGVKF